ncbi:rho GTPase-activating protein 31 isoform X1 [Huso huso]|uniref:Rho GTPase-activating protein 31 isoform X1 n=2 Tax=Acipenseroidei TaxID=186622 RepID=A0ABR0ZNU4_HUSHU
MKNKAAKQKSKRKGIVSAFGCDLTEYLQSSGQDVPQVLKCCAEFIEEHGIVDGIYRLSGITSNIQRLRQEFGSDPCPDLTREVYLQDIHCVGSLCKLYFRELPNPLLTYELYKKFTDAVSVKEEQEQLARIQNVIKELPETHYRTLEYLTRHLTHLASFSTQTNMHARNIALVWAPNLLRSKEIEISTCNGDAAFMEVRIQQAVVEFILNHIEQIFNNASHPAPESDERSAVAKCMSLPASGQAQPMKLVSLEEAQARSLSPNHPARRERRENSLPDTSLNTGTLYHTVIDLPDNKRKLSGKSKMWKSIFNLGRSGSESKSKLSRNGSVFVRGQKLAEKATIRPAKSMDSLCSLPTEEDEKDSQFKRSAATGGFFMPAFKSRTLGTGSTYDLSKQDHDSEHESLPGAMRGSSPVNKDKMDTKNTPQHKPLPEQLKVFKGDDLNCCEPTSPKTRRMFYSTSASDGTSKPTFPGSLFPLEASPRHQRKALNISEPFAVSVPLRVSAVISSNSTPCRTSVKDKNTLPPVSEASPLKTSNDSGLADQSSCCSSSSGCSSGSNSSDLITQNKEDKQVPTVNCGQAAITIMDVAEGDDPTRMESQCRLTDTSEYPKHSPVTSIDEQQQQPPCAITHQSKLNILPSALGTDTAALMHSLQTVRSSDELPAIFTQVDTTQAKTHLEILLSETEELAELSELTDESAADALMDNLWPEIQLELKIIEPDVDIIDEDIFVQSPPLTVLISDDLKQTADPNAKRTSSFSTYPLLPSGPADEVLKTDLHISDENCSGENSSYMVPERNLSCDVSRESNPNLNVLAKTGNKTETTPSIKPTGDSRSNFHTDNKEKLPCVYAGTQPSSSKINESISAESEGGLIPESDKAQKKHINESVMSSGLNDLVGPEIKSPRLTSGSKNLSLDLLKSSARLSKYEEDSPYLLIDKDESGLDISCALELVEPWEDYTQQWVTSPLHSPNTMNILQKQDDFPVCSTTENVFFNRRSSCSALDAREQLKELCTDVTKLRVAAEPSQEGGSKAESEMTSSMTPNLQAENWLLPPSESLKPLSVKTSGAKQLDSIQLAASSAASKAHTESANMNITEEELCKLSKETPSLQQDSLTTLDSMESQGQQNSGCDKPNENIFLKHRPSSLNLDLGSAFGNTTETTSNPCKYNNNVLSNNALHCHGSVTLSESKTADECRVKSKYSASSLELEMFLTDRQAPVRRNSAPVSVSSVRTTFMIKTCQAKAVPVIPPQIQYTQIPLPLQNKNSDTQTDQEKTSGSSGRKELDSPQAHPFVSDHKDEKENNEPAVKTPRHSGGDSSLEMPLPKSVVPVGPPVLRRKRNSNGEAFVDLSSKSDRSPAPQKPSYRARSNRPQSLILFSPPFPIMDHPSAGSKSLLSPIKSPTERSALDCLSKELADNLKTPEGVTLRNKMTMPKSGQKLETSTSCFYQPQRRSMIFDSRSSRQIE